jgi:ribA/ribD-fused uncharacterized protein
MVLFWGRDSPLSNHNTDYPFTVNGEIFSSSEQFYCASKAEFFNDRIARQKIMATKDPISQNRIPVKGFNDKEWAIVADDYMKQGLSHKFNKSITLKQLLVGTGTRIIGEASP